MYHHIVATKNSTQQLRVFGIEMTCRHTAIPEKKKTKTDGAECVTPKYYTFIITHVQSHHAKSWAWVDLRGCTEDSWCLDSTPAWDDYTTAISRVGQVEKNHMARPCATFLIKNENLQKGKAQKKGYILAGTKSKQIFSQHASWKSEGFRGPSGYLHLLLCPGRQLSPPNCAGFVLRCFPFHVQRCNSPFIEPRHSQLTHVNPGEGVGKQTSYGSFPWCVSGTSFDCSLQSW